MEVLVPSIVNPAVPAAVVSKLVALLELAKEEEHDRRLVDDIGSMKRELDMIAGETEDDLISRRTDRRPPGVVRLKSREEMRDLAHDMEDCLDRFLPCTVCGGKLPSSTSRQQFAAEVKRLKERLAAAHERRGRYKDDDNAGAQEEISTAAAPAAATPAVGIDIPKQEVLELLGLQAQADDAGDEPPQLRVIPIVGFGGSGKTTLARAVYDSLAGEFSCHAWVEARRYKGTEELLAALLHKLLRSTGSLTSQGLVHSHLQHLQSDIKTYLMNNKRYFIVFDDIEEQQWESIKSIFPEEAGSRIIVTTSMQQVAKACSSHGNGYVYSMRALDEEHSKGLLDAVLGEYSPGLHPSSIVDKCDGHPLALVSVANFLAREDLATEREREQFCRDLGYHMQKSVVFSKLRQVLTDIFVGLPGNPLRTCLQYMCVFPNGREIKRKNLIRRWLAEGYVQCQFPRSDQEVADDNFRELTDRSIVRPIAAGKNGKAKTCRTHGIMHEFMLRESMSSNFITSLRDPNRSNSCHLFVAQTKNPCGSGSTVAPGTMTNPAAATSGDPKKKLRARSLTICGNAGEHAACFNQCELLRVLDLEECGDGDIDGIGRLCHLKYVSLGGTVASLPRGLGRLHCLETLDLRKSSVETVVPIEIIRLPHLAHLLGKIKVNKELFKISKHQRILSKQSNLQTLAGFVLDNTSALPQLMAHMKMLRKVKIWCSSSTDLQGGKSWAHLLKAVNKFVQEGIDTATESRSLSLYLGNTIANFLHSLDALFLKDHSLGNSYGYLTSLKLHGELNQFPRFVALLCGLTELCLSSTNLSASELSNLCKLRRLNYLKLVQDDLEGFLIEKGHFPELRGLCIVVRSPKLPVIREGASPKLVSLQLLCRSMHGLSEGINITCFKQLGVVALDSKVNPGTVQIWESTAKKHPKRPRVLLLERIVPNDTDSMVKYVAAERPAPRMGSPQCEIDAAQSSSTGDLISADLNHSLPGPSLASTEMPSIGLIGTA
uniref:Uncharacterized protein n=1 Tax=Oryza brachyantha TaxID=4533 RepID=J3M558_ORYBR